MGSGMFEDRYPPMRDGRIFVDAYIVEEAEGLDYEMEWRFRCCVFWLGKYQIQPESSPVTCLLGWALFIWTIPTSEGRWLNTRIDVETTLVTTEYIL